MKEADLPVVHSSVLPKLVSPAMVQEVCFTDMFQSASPRHYPGPQGPTAAAMTSSYGYPGLYHHAPTTQSHMPYPGSSACTDPYGYPVQPPDPQSQPSGGSPTSWATTYANNISPRAASTGLVDEWGSGAAASFMTSQAPLSQHSTQAYGGYRPPPPPTGLSGFDPMGLPGQYPSENPASHSPLGGSGGTSGPLQSSSSPADHGNGTATSSASGTTSRGHVRQPYDWMKKQPYPTMPASGKTRTKDKYRIVYSEYQKVELEKEYLYSKYITIQRKAELARAIGLSERQVKIWFQNRRAKERKQKRKREDVIAAAQSTSSDISMHSPEGPMAGVSNISMSVKMEHHQQQQQQQQNHEHIKPEMHHPDFSAHAQAHAQVAH